MTRPDAATSLAYHDRTCQPAAPRGRCPPFRPNRRTRHRRNDLRLVRAARREGARQSAGRHACVGESRHGASAHRKRRHCRSRHARQRRAQGGLRRHAVRRHGGRATRCAAADGTGDRRDDLRLVRDARRKSAGEGAGRGRRVGESGDRNRNRQSGWRDSRAGRADRRRQESGLRSDADRAAG